MLFTRQTFSATAHHITQWAGSRWAFLLALSSIALWIPFGPLMHYSDTWQLIANTGTTLITYLMVFLIQHTQNHDSRALQMKLDAILDGLGKTDMIGIEQLSDAELVELQERLK